MDSNNLFEQMATITKAHAYDIVREQNKELQAELEMMKGTFYMDICRAYNAGKNNVIQHHNNNGDFISSHDYFKTEFPNFKTNVP